MAEKILLVEDEEKLARMVEMELRYEGYEVTKAFDGRSGLDQALSGKYDLVLLDIKHIDDGQHKILTGQSNQNILELAEYLSDIGKPVWIRHVLVPGRSDEDAYLIRLHDFIATLKNVEKVEVLPYHTMGVYKWKELGLEYPLEGVEPPTTERVENAKRILNT